MFTDRNPVIVPPRSPNIRQFYDCLFAGVKTVHNEVVPKKLPSRAFTSEHTNVRDDEWFLKPATRD